MYGTHSWTVFENIRRTGVGVHETEIRGLTLRLELEKPVFGMVEILQEGDFRDIEIPIGSTAYSSFDEGATNIRAIKFL